MAKIERTPDASKPQGNSKVPANNPSKDKDEKNPYAKKSIEELKAECDEYYKKIKNAKRDLREMSIEEKSALRKLYSGMGNIASTIAKNATDIETKEKFKTVASKAREQAKNLGSAVVGEAPKTTMDDIKGLENVKELVRSFLFMVQNPQLMDYYHIKGGCSMLMYGAPGTGKSMFAEAIANEMNLPIFKVSPADIFKPYVGQSEASVKELFEELDACEEGAVLFIDECESIFSARTSDTKDYKAAVTTELLQAMNGFGVEGSKRIIVGATNRPEEIDAAYLRYKRFSHLVHVSPPDREALEAIIRGKLKGIELAPDVDVETILEMCEKYTAPKKQANENDPVFANASSMLDKLEILKPDGNKMADYERSYYTPADLNGILEEACRQALVQIEQNRGTEPIPVTKEMFERAFRKIKPSVSESMLRHYENFRNIDKK